MGNEIQFEAPSLTGETLYAVIARVADGYRWETATPAFEARNIANWTDYDIALAETNGEWKGDFPAAIGAGLYDVSVYQQASVPGDPAYTDTRVGSALMQWDGAAEIPLAVILADTDALESRLTIARANLLNNLIELAAGNLPSDVDTLVAYCGSILDHSGEILADTDALDGRLTGARAARLDADVSSRATPADVHVTVTPAYARQSSRRVGGIIHLPEDSDETLAWHLTDADGKDVDLTGYTGLDLEVYAASGDLLFERTLANGGLVVDNAEHGRVTITFTPDNLETAGTCKYEFWGTREGGLPTCLARGTLIVEPTFGPTA